MTRYRRVPRRRPPWWPEEEPWPPTGPPNLRIWRQLRGHFFLRFGLFLLLLFFLAVGGFTLLFWAVASTLGLIDISFRGPHLPISVWPLALTRIWWLVPIVLIGVGLASMARALRRAAVPFGDLMEAAGRVAAGDYDVRVTERGPREMRALAHSFNEMATQLQLNDEQRRNLLADVTHELRTPLTVIQGNLEGLLDGVYPRDDSHLGPILEETRVLGRLIDDLRTLSLAEAGALKLRKEPTDMVALVNEVLNTFRPQAATSGVDLTSIANNDLPAVDIDAGRIREVLENLISNAVRFTPRGGQVHVECSFDRPKNQIIVAVTDSGSGISSQDLPHVFDRFFKSKDSRGMGLGLAIAKNLVSLHGGEISAESQAGQGTTIRFSLPATE